MTVAIPYPPLDGTTASGGQELANLTALATAINAFPPAGSVPFLVPSIAQLKTLNPLVNSAAILADNTNPPINYAYVTGDFTGADDEVNVVKLGGTPINVGAMVRQSSAGITFKQVGTGAAIRAVQARLRETISALDFGAKGDGIADDTAAITAWITAAKALSTPHMVLPFGNYLVSDTLTFDVPNGTTLEFYGIITSSVSSKDATVFGPTTGNKTYYRITGLDVRRTSYDTTAAPGAAGGSIGVRLVNLVWSKVHIQNIGGFSTGLLTIGNVNGFAYNEISLGSISNNRTNLRCSQSGGGYNNENLYLGGSLNHASGYPAVSTTNLLIDKGASEPLYLNNNVFVKLAMEDNADPAGGVVAATINGENNLLLWPRLENSVGEANYKIYLTADSAGCTITGGIGVGIGNISDLGAANNYTTSDGNVTKKSTPNATGQAVHTFQSTSDSGARLIRVLDATGAETGYITGQGYFNARNAGAAYSQTVVYPSGIQFGSGAAAVDMGIDRQLGGIMRFSGADLYPDTNGTRYLGGASGQWRALFVKDGVYVNGNLKLGSTPGALPAAATDLATAITLVNALRALAVAEGQGT